MLRSRRRLADALGLLSTPMRTKFGNADDERARHQVRSAVSRGSRQPQYVRPDKPGARFGGIQAHGDESSTSLLRNSDHSRKRALLGRQPPYQRGSLA